LISFTLEKFKDRVVCDVFLCMRQTYCWGDPSMMSSEIGMLWRKLKKVEEVE
jgi:hypothetical protein